MKDAYGRDSRATRVNGSEGSMSGGHNNTSKWAGAGAGAVEVLGIAGEMRAFDRASHNPTGGVRLAGCGLTLEIHKVRWDPMPPPQLT